MPYVKALNPFLYRELAEIDPTIRISNAGEEFSALYWDLGVGPRKLRIKRWGETYRICCPECARKRAPDHNYQLSVNHSWGVRDSEGNRLWFLIKCHANNCFKDFTIRDAFAQRVYEGHVITTDDLLKGREWVPSVVRPLEFVSAEAEEPSEVNWGPGGDGPEEFDEVAEPSEVNWVPGEDGPEESN